MIRFMRIRVSQKEGAAYDCSICKAKFDGRYDGEYGIRGYTASLSEGANPTKYAHVCNNCQKFIMELSDVDAYIAFRMVGQDDFEIEWKDWKKKPQNRKDNLKELENFKMKYPEIAEEVKRNVVMDKL